MQPAYPCLCDLTVAQVRSLKIILYKNAHSNSRSGIVCNSGNLLNHKVHMHYSETNGAALSSSPLQTRCLESLSALATLSNCRRSGSPRLSFLTCFFLATGRPLTWGGQGRIDTGRVSADERGAAVKTGCVRAETIPS